MENVDIVSFSRDVHSTKSFISMQNDSFLWMQTSMISEEASERLKPDKSSLAKCSEIGHSMQLGDLHLPFHMGHKTISVQITETVQF